MCLWRSINWCLEWWALWISKDFVDLIRATQVPHAKWLGKPVTLCRVGSCFLRRKKTTPKCIGRMIQKRLNKFPQSISTHRSRRNVNYLWILNAVQKSDRYREQQSDHVYYSSLWHVYKFALPCTSLSYLCTNAGPNTLLTSQTGKFSLFFIQF